MDRRDWAAALILVGALALVALIIWLLFGGPGAERGRPV